jgi:hypothetical protein
MRRRLKITQMMRPGAIRSQLPSWCCNVSCQNRSFCWNTDYVSSEERQWKCVKCEDARVFFTWAQIKISTTWVNRKIEINYQNDQ